MAAASMTRGQSAGATSFGAGPGTVFFMATDGWTMGAPPSPSVFALFPLHPPSLSIPPLPIFPFRTQSRFYLLTTLPLSGHPLSAARNPGLNYL